MDQNLRETSAYYRTPDELQSAIDATRRRLESGQLNQQQTEANRESLANYLRIAALRGWKCQ